jgi:hypothetical protein
LLVKWLPYYLEIIAKLFTHMANVNVTVPESKDNDDSPLLTRSARKLRRAEASFKEKGCIRVRCLCRFLGTNFSSILINCVPGRPFRNWMTTISQRFVPIPEKLMCLHVVSVLWLPFIVSRIGSMREWVLQELFTVLDLSGGCLCLR